MPVVEETISITRGFPVEHLSLVWKWLNDYEDQTLDDYSPKTEVAMIEKRETDLVNGMVEFSVLLDDLRPVGMVWFDFMGDGMYNGHLCFERHRLSACDMLSAVVLALRSLFSAGARKVYWQIMSDNRAFHIFLRKIKAKQEGLLTQATRRKGELVDIRIMATYPSEVAT